jgi:hypothetical protein
MVSSEFQNKASNAEIQTLESVLHENMSTRFEKSLDYLSKTNLLIKGCINNKFMNSSTKPIEYLGRFIEITNDLLFALVKIVFTFFMLAVVSQSFWLTLISSLKNSWNDTATFGYLGKGICTFKVLISSIIQVVKEVLSIALDDSDFKFKDFDLNDSFYRLFTKLDYKVKDLDTKQRQ